MSMQMWNALRIVGGVKEYLGGEETIKLRTRTTERRQGEFKPCRHCLHGVHHCFNISSRGGGTALSI